MARDHAHIKTSRPDRRGVRMTWRVQWTKPGGIGPEWHDFWALGPAELLRDIKQAQGCEHVTIHQLPEGDQ